MTSLPHLSDRHLHPKSSICIILSRSSGSGAHDSLYSGIRLFSHPILFAYIKTFPVSVERFPDRLCLSVSIYTPLSGRFHPVSVRWLIAPSRMNRPWLCSLWFISISFYPGWYPIDPWMSLSWYRDASRYCETIRAALFPRIRKACRTPHSRRWFFSVYRFSRLCSSYLSLSCVHSEVLWWCRCNFSRYRSISCRISRWYGLWSGNPYRGRMVSCCSWGVLSSSASHRFIDPFSLWKRGILSRYIYSFRESLHFPLVRLWCNGESFSIKNILYIHVPRPVGYGIFHRISASRHFRSMRIWWFSRIQLSVSLIAFFHQRFMTTQRHMIPWIMCSLSCFWRYFLEAYLMGVISMTIVPYRNGIYNKYSFIL